jgi:hypothetical protein
MAEVSTPGWTRIFTPAGCYEYQFQGRTPAVRNGKYEDSADYVFLVMDQDGLLYRIPVRVSAEAEAAMRLRVTDPGPSGQDEVIRVATMRLRAGLETFQPRQNTPYGELDAIFAIDASTAQRLLTEKKTNRESTERAQRPQRLK